MADHVTSDFAQEEPSVEYIQFERQHEDTQALWKEDRWWDTFNAVLQGYIPRDDTLARACTYATKVHGFTPEGYKGPREETTTANTKESK